MASIILRDVPLLTYVKARHIPPSFPTCNWIAELLSHWSSRTTSLSFLQTQNHSTSSYSFKPLQRTAGHMITNAHSDPLFNIPTASSCTPNSFQAGYLHVYTISQNIFPPYFSSPAPCCNNPFILFIIITMIKISLYYLNPFLIW